MAEDIRPTIVLVPRKTSAGKQELFTLVLLPVPYKMLDAKNASFPILVNSRENLFENTLHVTMLTRLSVPRLTDVRLSGRLPHWYDFPS